MNVAGGFGGRLKVTARKTETLRNNEGIEAWIQDRFLAGQMAMPIESLASTRRELR
jgi:hypothetical protein